MQGINIIDIGFYGGISEPWITNYSLVDNILISDPLINYEFGGKIHVFKHVIFDEEGYRPFYIYKKEKCSSLFVINEELVRELMVSGILSPNRAKYQLKSVRQEKCIRLDTLLSNENINISFDAIKTDAQGSDFNIIISLGSHLQSLICLQIELYKKPFYKDSILFNEANPLLESLGFKLVRGLRNKENDLFDDFLYINYNTLKREKLDIIKHVYGI